MSVSLIHKKLRALPTRQKRQDQHPATKVDWLCFSPCSHVSSNEGPQVKHIRNKTILKRSLWRNNAEHQPV